MDKREFTSVMQAMLLLYDGVREEEVKRLVGEEYVGFAKGVTEFIRSYKL